MKLAVFGMMGLSPFAGVAWQVLHYLEGFKRLGWDVVYAEDTEAWPYDPVRNEITDEPGYTVAYIARLVERVGVPWVYVAPDGRTYGMEEQRWASELASCDALVNLTGATLLREVHLQVPTRIYLETDPVLPQVEVAQGRSFTIGLLEAHTHHFSYGELLGSPESSVPVERFRYLPTRQPVVLDWWTPSGAARPEYTTVASWRQTDKDLEWMGETYYWSKDREFRKVLDLPSRSPAPLELALACDDGDDIELLRSHGWRVTDGFELSRELEPYRDYITASHAEFTVAKDQNVRLRSGWFSDRSACYLAAGKPVVTQDTGFGSVMPTGDGLFAFNSLDDAAAAIEAIERDYARHSRAARIVAEEQFAAERVLARLLSDAGVR